MSKKMYLSGAQKGQLIMVANFIFDDEGAAQVFAMGYSSQRPESRPYVKEVTLIELSDAMANLNRCQVCGWPLVDDPVLGCTVNSCSQRGGIMIDLRCGDCLELLKSIPDASIDAVITDPPYPKKYMYLYGAIASQLPRILKKGGSFLAIVPHYALPPILADVGQYLKYRWVFSMWQANSSHSRMAMGIEVMRKPIVWWVNGSWPQGRGFVRDGFENDRPSKENHVWEQALPWAEFCLKVTQLGDTVLDPLMGSGTMGVACVRAGRNFIGFELVEHDYNIAKERIELAQKGGSGG